MPTLRTFLKAIRDRIDDDDIEVPLGVQSARLIADIDEIQSTDAVIECAAWLSVDGEPHVFLGSGKLDYAVAGGSNFPETGIEVPLREHTRPRRLRIAIVASAQLPLGGRLTAD